MNCLSIQIWPYMKYTAFNLLTHTRILHISCIRFFTVIGGSRSCKREQISTSKLQCIFFSLPLSSLYFEIDLLESIYFKLLPMILTIIHTLVHWGPKELRRLNCGLLVGFILCLQSYFFGTQVFRIIYSLQWTSCFVT